MLYSFVHPHGLKKRNQKKNKTENRKQALKFKDKLLALVGRCIIVGALYK